jgi:hypothetical protein
MTAPDITETRGMVDERDRRPSVPEPDLDEYMIETFFGDTPSEAIDGCEGIDPCGQCEHGAVSWELYWGYVSPRPPRSTSET